MGLEEQFEEIFQKYLTDNNLSKEDYSVFLEIRDLDIDINTNESVSGSKIDLESETFKDFLNLEERLIIKIGDYIASNPKLQEKQLNLGVFFENINSGKYSKGSKVIISDRNQKIILNSDEV